MKNLLRATGRFALVPVRLALGLPPVYGLTIKCRTLQLLRLAGIYKGRIDFVFMAPPINLAGGLNGLR